MKLKSLVEIDRSETGTRWPSTITFVRCRSKPGKDGPQLLSSVNPTFTWVRLAQRIPVTIHFARAPPGVLVSAGMTCTVVMKEGAAPQIGLGIKKVMAAIFGAPSG